jgi:hypothetical protein
MRGANSWNRSRSTRVGPVPPICSNLTYAEKETRMFFSLFLVLFIVLFVAWIVGWFAFHVAGGLIHLLLIVAFISLIVHFARGRP